MMRSPVSVPYQVRDALQAQNMTQAECAKRTGLSPQYISDIVRGRRAVSTRAAFALERVLRLDARKLLHEQIEEQLYAARKRKEQV